MKNRIDYFIAAHIIHSDDIYFDKDTTNYLMKETGKTTIAIEAPNYGVGIFLDEDFGVGGYGDNDDTQIAFKQFVINHKHELSTIREIANDSGNLEHSAELILCGFIVDLEKNAYRNHLLQ